MLPVTGSGPGCYYCSCVLLATTRHPLAGFRPSSTSLTPAALCHSSTPPVSIVIHQPAMPHWIQDVFGTTDLYEILGCPRDAPRNVLRKAYYRSALKYHPDKNTNDTVPEAQANQEAGGTTTATTDSSKRFQAVSLAYQILENETHRAEYDATGIIPGDDATLDDDDINQAGFDQWKDYFDKIFGRVTTSKIDAFAQQYKCSDEERRDVLAAFSRCKGNLNKMIDVVLVSEYRDATRWVDDYLRPAMDQGQLDRTYEATMDKSLKVCQKKAQQQDEATETEDDEEDEEVEMEEEEEEEDDDDERDASPKPPTPVKKGRAAASSRQASKPSPKKAGKTRTKPTSKSKSQSKSKMDDLVAAIQNKGRGGNSNNLWANLGARYGVSLNDDVDDDPLSGEQFQQAQTRLLQNKKTTKNQTTKSSTGKRK